jgi:acetone carboxylase gamma subunit
VNYPFREHLAVENAEDGKWIRCTQCGHRLCAFDQDWKTACLKKTFSPTSAGPLMNILDGRYLFEKLYCPSCNVLLNADMVEVKNES